MRYLAIDYGKKRIGLAIGEIIPKGCGIISGEKKREKIISEIKNICDSNEVDEIVLGIPIRGNGSKGELAFEIEKFARELESKLKIRVNFEQEQFTSVSAEQIYKDYGQSFDKKKGDIDEMSAILILEQFLSDKIRENKTEKQ